MSAAEMLWPLFWFLVICAFSFLGLVVLPELFDRRRKRLSRHEAQISALRGDTDLEWVENHEERLRIERENDPDLKWARKSGKLSHRKGNGCDH